MTQLITREDDITHTVTRRIATFPSLPLDLGGSLSPVTLAYETWGTLNTAADNVIILCHALTGDTHAYDPALPNDQQSGWWNPLIGPGQAIDTDRYFVICINVLGSCYGSSGPTSINPDTGQRYRCDFPHVTIGDIVRSQHLVIQTLGIQRIHAVIGGSLGGLQALEWSLAYPEMVDRAVVIAAAPRLSAQGLAIDDIARQSIMADPSWQLGNYPHNSGPSDGLAIARMLAMLTYTSAEGLETRFGRRTAIRGSSRPAFGLRRDVETYLHHQGTKLVNRFDANSYLYLTYTMDLYDAAERRGNNDVEAFSHIAADVLAIGISSDWLYPARQVQTMHESIVAAGGHATYREIVSPNGHDAFLQEWDQLDAMLRPFLSTKR